MTAASASKPSSGEPRPASIAQRAIGATIGLYGAYVLVGLAGVPGDFRYLGLIAGFYFLPGWMLRHDPARQLRYQVGPGSVLPPWKNAALGWAAVTALVVFPVFVASFWGFYHWVCAAPIGSGGVPGLVGRLCERHAGGFWPPGVRLPAAWLEYGGAGVLLAVVTEVFAVALPEEVFHRGYLMSALEERWPARRRLWGAPLGMAAVVSSAMFALGHLVGMADVGRLATFFPAMLFAWLWRRSNSLWAPTLVHAGSNLLMAILIASTFSN